MRSIHHGQCTEVCTPIKGIHTPNLIKIRHPCSSTVQHLCASQAGSEFSPSSHGLWPAAMQPYL